MDRLVQAVTPGMMPRPDDARVHVVPEQQADLLGHGQAVAGLRAETQRVDGPFVHELLGEVPPHHLLVGAETAGGQDHPRGLHHELSVGPGCDHAPHRRAALVQEDLRDPRLGADADAQPAALLRQQIADVAAQEAGAPGGVVTP